MSYFIANLSLNLLVKELLSEIKSWGVSPNLEGPPSRPTDPSVVAPMRTMRECMRCVASIAVHMINIDTLARL